MIGFRFDRAAHQYFDAGGDEMPHITGLLKRAGLVNDAFYLEEHAARGQQVHRLTADYDLGALDAAICDGPLRGYLLAHVAVMAALKPTWSHIEVPMLAPRSKFGGRPDRVGTIHRLPSVYEGKTGGVERWHQIQTALQAILVSEFTGGLLPPERFQRLAGYYKANGKFKVETHTSRWDFDEARRILREYV